MVTEMTSLQGVIGREYALRSGEPEAVARGDRRALPGHPRIAGRARPWRWQTDWTRWWGCSPWTWRRPARRIRSGCDARPWESCSRCSSRIGTSIWRRRSQQAAKLQPVKVDAKRQAEVLDFIRGRLAVLLKDAGFRYDVVDAVLAEQAANPAGARRSVQQLQAWVERRGLEDDPAGVCALRAHHARPEEDLRGRCRRR